MANKINTGTSRKQVFISYSHLPASNAEFVRDLTGRLTTAGFEVWLDEERIAAGDDYERVITAATGESEVGLFIVTERWVDRPWTRHEVALFGGRDDARLLVVQREPVNTGALGPYLARLQIVDWPESDDEPNARFWEIYCGITGERPGRRSEWAAKGRSVTFGVSQTDPRLPPPPSVPSPRLLCEPALRTSDPKIGQTTVGKIKSQPRGAGAPIPLQCSGKPVSYIVGERWTYLVTNLEEWLGLGPNGEAHVPIGRLAEHSTIHTSANCELLVGTYDPMIALLRGEHWEYQRLDAAALCFASCPLGDLAGTASGTIVMMNGGDPKSIFQIRDPVIGIALCDRDLLVLGAQGMFGRFAWPQAKEKSLQWIETAALGRPVGFFQSMESNNVGIYSATKIGIVDPASEKVAVCPTPFDEGVREIVFLGAQVWPYVVLTDNGSLIMVDASVRRTRETRLPRGAKVHGCIAGGLRGTPIVWTNEGKLYKIPADQAVECIAENDIVLAYSPTGAGANIHVVRWHEERGASVQILGV